MARIFAIITAVLLAVSAFLATKNKAAYQKEIDTRKSAERSLNTNSAKLADLQQKRDAKIEEKRGVQEQTVTKREEEEAQKTTNQKLKVEIAEKKKKSEEQAEAIAQIEEETAELGPLNELAGKIKRLTVEVAELEDEKVQTESQLAMLIGQKNSTQSVIDRYNKEGNQISSGKSYGSARISSIFGPWGFVTLSAGSNGGIVTRSTLDVVRGGERIAQLRVRSVEPGRASADLIPDSISEDVTLIVGDRVVPADASAQQ